MINPRYEARTALIIAVGINGNTHAEIPVAKLLDVKKQNITRSRTLPLRLHNWQLYLKLKIQYMHP